MWMSDYLAVMEKLGHKDMPFKTVTVVAFLWDVKKIQTNDKKKHCGGGGCIVVMVQWRES